MAMECGGGRGVGGAGRMEECAFFGGFFGGKKKLRGGFGCLLWLIEMSGGRVVTRPFPIILHPLVLVQNFDKTKNRNHIIYYRNPSQERDR